MKPSEDLFRLIKSLSPTEKRYFKRVAAQHVIGEGNNYVKLFSAIDRQEAYDEETIRKQFSGQSFTANLHVAKGYLYKLVKKSLLNYHAGSSADAELKDSLRFIDILFEKGLYAECGKEIARAKALASKYEQQLASAELSAWEIELMKTAPGSGQTEKESERSYDELYSSLELHKNAMEYNHAISRIFFSRKSKGLTRSKGDLGTEELLGGNRKPGSFRAKYYYYTCLLSHSFMRNDYKKAAEHMKKQVQLLEDHPHQIEERPRAYSSSLGNLVLCLHNLRRFKEIPSLIAKLKALNTRSPLLNREIYYTSSLQELDLYIDTGYFEKAGQLVREIDARQDARDMRAVKKWDETHLHYSMAYACFGAGNYALAKKYINRIINDTSTIARSDLHCFARILNLLVHIELGDGDLLEYIVRSTYRYLYKRNKLFRFESSVLQFIRKQLPLVRTEKQLREAFVVLRKELSVIVKDPYEKTALTYFDFITWLDSKIEGKRFAEVMREGK